MSSSYKGFIKRKPRPGSKTLPMSPKMISPPPICKLWWLLAAATGPDYFAVADGVLRSWFGKLVMLGAIWALWYHTLAGLRHLWFDSGRGLDIPTAEKLGWGIIAGSVLLTFATIILF
jgi:succinate dehydrogenase / fumarate reductase cytochrome b subunit